MLSLPRRTRPVLRRMMAAAVVLAALSGLGGWSARAEESVSPDPAEVMPGVLTSFEQIWGLSEADQKQWHHVQLDYDIYYYDPLWLALWGRCGEADSYISLGTKVFPIKAGQRIRIEGLMQPARGMRVDAATVKVLSEKAELQVLSTKGNIARTEMFNKRMVVIEGLVDRQLARDANHLELYLVTEGRSILLQLLLTNDVPMPQLKGTSVRARGVYFARSDPAWAGPKIEIWVQGRDDVEQLASLDRDERFNLPVTPLGALAGVRPDTLAHVAGTVTSQQVGRTIVIADDQNNTVSLQTVQTNVFRPGEQLDAVGLPIREDGAWSLRESLVRPLKPVTTTIDQLWQLSEADRQKWHNVQLEFLVYFYDPDWKILWGRSGDSDGYLSLGDKPFPIKPGQRVLIEGTVRPANNMVVEDARVTVLADAVPLEALPTRGRIGDVDHLQKHLVTVEGYVDRQVVMDARHVQLDMVIEGTPVVGRLLLKQGETAPKWEGALLRLTGVYLVTRDASGGPPTLEVFTPGLESVQMLGSIHTDARFNIAATPIEKLETVAPKTLVRILGTVRAQQPGKSLTVRDETGQLTLHTVQARPVPAGTAVEAIGYPIREANELNLADGLFRLSQAVPPTPATGLPKLRLADQLRELTPEEAARGYPVQLSGIVTWARPNADFFYVRDVSGGVRVLRPSSPVGSMYVGTKVELTGVSAAGKFSPVVLASNVQTFSSIELPEARPVTLEQAVTGIEEAQWVSMSGYVRAVVADSPWTRLELTTSAGEFSAIVPPDDRWPKLADAVIRVRGVCVALANDKRQLTGIQVWVPSRRFVDVEDPAPEDPFLTPTRSIASLRQFGSGQPLSRRVRVSGVVIHQAAGRLLHLQEGAEGLLVLSRKGPAVAPGDRIEAVGFPGRENSRVVLREAIYRRMAAGAEPAPLPVANLTPIDAELDGRLVRVEGLLLDLGTHENGVRLIAQQNESIFEALLDGPATALGAQAVPGSRIALTGVYQIQFDEYRRAHSVRLQLRSPADVTTLQAAPWWTARRALVASGILAMALVLGFGWVLALGRRVHRQTGMIRAQVENERAARLEVALARASKLESLGVLAGGIAHDFNNLLTVVMGNLSLAKLDPKLHPETAQCLSDSERAAARARDLTQQLLTFAKGGEPIRTAIRLPDIVREAADFALHGSKARCDFDFAPDLSPAHVDKGQISQVVHNLIINAIQAMPGGGVVRIALLNERVVQSRANLPAGQYVKLTLSDAGCGIPPQNLGRIFEPYFTTKHQGSGLGLATVYSIVKKHQGHIEVSSTVGQGTTFRLWLPAADAAPAPAVVEAKVAPNTPARILLMDDEAPIRKLGTAVLRRMGMDVTAVNDGTAAVDEYAAATAAGRPYQAVILDLTVPGGMGGAEAMEKLRAMDADVRAIVSSGYSADPVMAKYESYGFRARVPKPYLATDLMNAVKGVLQQSSS